MEMRRLPYRQGLLVEDDLQRVVLLFLEEMSHNQVENLFMSMVAEPLETFYLVKKRFADESFYAQIRISVEGEMHRTDDALLQVYYALFSVMYNQVMQAK